MEGARTRPSGTNPFGVDGPASGGWAGREKKRLGWQHGVALGIALGLVLSLAAVHLLRDYGRPRATLGKLHGALAAGAIDLLLEDENLGMSGRVEGEIRSRGQEAYDAVLAIYHRQRSLGEAEFETRRQRQSDIHRKAADAGESRFRALPEQERWNIWVGQRKIEWVFVQARAQVSHRYSSILPATHVFLEDAKAMGDWKLQLGREKLRTADQVLLDQALADPNLLSDPYYAEVKEKAERHGDTQASRALDKLQREIVAVETAAIPRPNASGAYDRERAKAAELGQASLTDEERAFLQANRDMLAATDREPHYLQLGWDRLTEDERQTLGSKPLAEFEAERDEYIDREGRSLYVAFLRSTFSRCTYGVKEQRFIGVARRSLLRNDVARLELEWSTDDCAAYAGDTMTLRFEEGRWRL